MQHKTNDDASCVKEKKFLFWKWVTIEHNYRRRWITKHMIASKTFKVIYKCSNCMATHTVHHVEQDTLLKAGISVKALRGIDNWNWYDCDINKFN